MIDYDYYLNLRSQIEEHNKLYYKLGTPLISDAEYDVLYRELEDLEAENPEWVDENSPTQRVGSDLGTSFNKVLHLFKMESINDIFEKKDGDVYVEVREFMNRIGNKAVTIEPKLDGCAVALLYKGGKLVHASTRGNGVIGDDITENVKTIRSIPLTLNGLEDDDEVEIRGEIFMTAKDFEILNASREEQGLSLFANPRNATAGSIKLLDSTEVAKRPLSFRAHGIVGLSESTKNRFWKIKDTWEYEQQLIKWDIPYCSPIFEAPQGRTDLVIKSIQDIKAMRDRGEFNYPIDGAVIKVLDSEYREELGSTARAPRWAAAFKYLPEQKETILRDIIIQVGRTGVLTPVAVVDPVRLSGTTVSRATLHNEDEIIRKDIRIGDTVVMEKCGEIIPAVVKVNLSKRPSDTRPYSILEAMRGVCPVCGGTIYKKPGEVAWRCSNDVCSAKTAMRILYMCKRDALDIEGIGTTVADALVREYGLRYPWEIFELDEHHWFELNLGTEDKIRLLGPKNGAKIVKALKKALTLPLDRWITALGIRMVGNVTAKRICEIISDLKQFTNWSSGTYSVMDEEIVKFWRSPYGQRFIEDMDVGYSFNPKSERKILNTNSSISGKTFVVTGTLSKPRKHFEDLITSNGAKVGSSVSKKTDYLLMGSDAGSKYDKALKYGIKIISEDEFMNMIE